MTNLVGSHNGVRSVRALNACAYGRVTGWAPCGIVVQRRVVVAAQKDSAVRFSENFRFQPVPLHLIVARLAVLSVNRALDH